MPDDKDITIENSEQPFGLIFSYDGKTISVQLKNGSDVMILADTYKQFLDNLNIEYEVSGA